jgi:hypothetical protein
LRTWVGEHLGAIAKPDEIRFADNLPKTRSGKIMRRLLRAIARGEEIAQDVSTLENPAILDQLRGEVPAAPSSKPPAKRRAARARAKPAPGKSSGTGKSRSRAKVKKSRRAPARKPAGAAAARATQRRRPPSKARARRAAVKRTAKSKTVRRAGRKSRSRR